MNSFFEAFDLFEVIAWCFATTSYKISNPQPTTLTPQALLNTLHLTLNT